jgi:hypothetical protein
MWSYFIIQSERSKHQSRCRIAIEMKETDKRKSKLIQIQGPNKKAKRESQSLLRYFRLSEMSEETQYIAAK